MKTILLATLLMISMNVFASPIRPYEMCDLNGGNCHDTRDICDMDGTNCQSAI